MALTDKIKDIADAIRAKTGTTGKMTLTQMSSAISSLYVPNTSTTAPSINITVKNKSDGIISTYLYYRSDDNVNIITPDAAYRWVEENGSITNIPENSVIDRSIVIKPDNSVTNSDELYTKFSISKDVYPYIFIYSYLDSYDAQRISIVFSKNYSITSSNYVIDTSVAGAMKYYTGIVTPIAKLSRRQLVEKILNDSSLSSSRLITSSASSGTYSLYPCTLGAVTNIPTYGYANTNWKGLEPLSLL